MYSPTNGFPRRGVQDAFNNSPRMSPSGQMFTPRNNPSHDFNSPRNNTSQMMYSPRNNTFEGMYSSRNSTPQVSYSPQNTSRPVNSPSNQSPSLYSPRNMSQNMYSPRNAPQGMYSHRNSTPRPNMFRKSFNCSRNSSDFNNSWSSNDSYSPRGMPYNKWNRKSGLSEKKYNIQDYVNPSMLENPWADLEAAIASKKAIGGRS